MTAGVDVSHYQTPGDVTAAMNAGALFVIVKTTDGATGVDPEHDQDVALVRQRGRVCGHYHFARHVSAAATEARWFLAHSGILRGEIAALDVEAMDGPLANPWPSRVAYVLTWLATVDNSVTARPILYCNLDWWRNLIANATAAQRAQLGAYPLWIATANKPPGQPGITGWDLHQYSTYGGIDHDILATGVTLADLTGDPTDMPLLPSDGSIIAPELFAYYTHDGKNLAGVIESSYDMLKAISGQPGVDVNALAAALAPLVHANVDAAALAAAIAPLVGPAVVAALQAHPLTPKP